MFVPGILAILLLTQQAGVHQITSGPCSPNIANVAGDVTVNCDGVAPQALAKLNAELKLLHVDIHTKITQANAWTERYKELERAFREHVIDRELAGKAEEYLHQGDLEGAGSILDQVLSKDAADEHSLAAAHYNLAGIYELQIQPLKALPHLKAAYEYYPEDPTYGAAYAQSLADDNRFSQAYIVLQKIMPEAETKAKGDSRWIPTLASLQSLSAWLYTQFRNYGEAAAPFQKAIRLQRELAEADPRRERDLVRTLDQLASFYMGTQRFKDAEDALLEVKGISERISQSSAIPDGMAHAQYRLGVFYSYVDKTSQAEDAFDNAVKKYRSLAAGKQATFRGGLAQALCSEGALYSAEKRFGDARPLLVECVLMLRELGKTDEDAYLPLEARGFADLGAVLGYLEEYMTAAQSFDEATRIYQKFDDEKTTVWAPDIASLEEKSGDLFKNFDAPEQAAKDYREALKLYRQLAKAHSETFTPALARTLDSLAFVCMKQDSLEEARTNVEEALALRRGLWQRDPGKYSDAVATTLLTTAEILVEQKVPCDQVAVPVKEALKLSPLQLIKQKAKDISEDCDDRQ